MFMGVLIWGVPWPDARATTARSVTAVEKDFLLTIEIVFLIQ